MWKNKSNLKKIKKYFSSALIFISAVICISIFSSYAIERETDPENFEFAETEFPDGIYNETFEKGQVAGEENQNVHEKNFSNSENYVLSDVSIGNNVAVIQATNESPLEISDIKSNSYLEEKESEVKLIVSWKTNKLSISEFFCATRGGNDEKKVTERSYAFNHNAVVSGLKPGTPYVYRIKSSDQYGNETSSDYFGIYTASKSFSVIELISEAADDAFGWALRRR